MVWNLAKIWPAFFFSMFKFNDRISIKFSPISIFSNILMASNKMAHSSTKKKISKWCIFDQISLWKTQHGKKYNCFYTLWVENTSHFWKITLHLEFFFHIVFISHFWKKNWEAHKIFISLSLALFFSFFNRLNLVYSRATTIELAQSNPNITASYKR